MASKYTHIDIFAGCGGLSAGLVESGWDGLFAIEKNHDAFSTFKHNLIDKKNGFDWPEWLPRCEHDIYSILQDHMSELLKLQGNVTLVAGGPPCQGFSMAGKRDKNDQRNQLVTAYLKFIEVILPKAIVFENVYGFMANFKGESQSQKYASLVVNKLESWGYDTAYRIIDMSEYGIPQKRKRYILIALKDNSAKSVFDALEFNRKKFLNKKKIQSRVSVLDAIGDLEQKYGTTPSPDSHGFLSGTYGPIESNYQRFMRRGLKNVAVDSHRFVNHRNDTITLHKDLLANAPVGKRIRPKDGFVLNLNRRGVTVLNPASQAPTITSIPDEIIHYSEPRVLTVREYARIQSFPDWYEFKGKYTSGGPMRKYEVPRYTQVANAVPPLFSEQIGYALLEVLSHE
ncbi:DNA cytosine methyltransferase [Candidatus Methanomassiliicoccus intestinalis]|uniref:DNA cytosine methyltransferase n=1 Tax=Candidatus Methanomassiliicoccus intestinalis TaxID=1406512 RepID=UPI0037DCC720